MRAKTHEFVQNGLSESDIKQHMRDRFGDFVLYDPPLERKTWLLWLAPIILLIGALLMLVRQLKQSIQRPIEPTINPSPNHNKQL